MSDISWEHFFEAEDFTGLDFSYADYKTMRQVACETANKKLWAVLQTQDTVIGVAGKGSYHGIPEEWKSVGVELLGSVTHIARLVDVRDIKK